MKTACQLYARNREHDRFVCRRCYSPAKWEHCKSPIKNIYRLCPFCYGNFRENGITSAVVCPKNPFRRPETEKAFNFAGGLDVPTIVSLEPSLSSSCFRDP